MKNRWASPEGFPERPPPIRYRILDKPSGKVVERQTTTLADYAKGGNFFHALALPDQEYSNGIRVLIQTACGWFYATDEEYEPLASVPGVVVTDDEVRERIARLDDGENTREALRVRKKRYPLVELPFEQQRALIEQIERHKTEWSFELLGEADPDAPPPEPEPPMDYPHPYSYGYGDETTP